MKSATRFRRGWTRWVGCAGWHRGHRTKLDKVLHGIMTLIQMDHIIVELAFGTKAFGTKAERVIADKVDCVWRMESGGGKKEMDVVVLTGVGVLRWMDAHMAAATAGRQQDTIAGGLQAQAARILVVIWKLGAGSMCAVPPSTHGKNANQPRPGP